MVAELGFPDGAWIRELASLLWNKVLQTSLSFAGVCSGAGVGSGSSPCTGVHRWPLSVVVLVLLSLSLLGLLSGTSVLLVRRSAATGHEEARGCSSSMVPTADGLLPRISCSLLFGVRSSFWMAADGGWLLWCASLRSEDRRLPVSTKKKNSSGWLGFVVILCFIRVLSTRKGCTMLTFI